VTNVYLNRDDKARDRYYLSYIPRDQTVPPAHVLMTLEDLKDLYFKVGAELIDREFESMYEGDTGE